MRETILVAQPLESLLDVETLARACCVDIDTIAAWVAEGILDATGTDPARWQFETPMLARGLRVARLQRDLGLDPAAAAICVELLDRIEQLRAQVRALEFQIRG